MNITKKAFAGTLESSDVLVEIEPSDGSVAIDVDSIVLKQFGAQIRETAEQVLQLHHVTAASVRIFDRGALDCTIRARLETALFRAAKEEPA